MGHTSEPGLSQGRSGAIQAEKNPHGGAFPHSGSIVSIQGLTKRFPIRRGWRETILHPRSTRYQDALQAVSLEVGEGEFFGLLGRNGAGKTTLFKILATLVLPDQGSARIQGLDVTEDPDRIRRLLVPVIPYERSLYWRLSARENVRLYAALQGFSRAEGDRRTGQVLERVGLEDVGDKQVGLFSSGMKQRLLLARALLSDPRVLLLDEPTRSLDPMTARNLRRFLREEINERQGCTVLLATHDADEVRELCHRVGILEEGRLLVAGPTQHLLESVGQDSYTLVARGLAESMVQTMASQGLITAPEAPRALESGWKELRLRIPGGREDAGRVLKRLVAEGVQVASLAPRELPLAELIETVVVRSKEESILG